MSDLPVESTKGISDAFTRKIGPLPGYVWALIVVGGAYAIYAIRKRTASGGSSGLLGGLIGTQTTPSDATPGTVGADGSSLSATTPQTGSGLNSSPTVVGAQTNPQWAVNAENVMSANGTYASGDVARALSDYLNGNTLDTQEQGIVNTVLQQFGAPPEGVVAPNTTAAYTSYLQNNSAIYGVTPSGQLVHLTESQWAAITAADPTAVSKVKMGSTPNAPYIAALSGSSYHNYTAKAGDTAQSIATQFYGNATRAGELVDANTGNHIMGTTLTAGQVIAVPV